jgi:hypothetical protein
MGWRGHAYQQFALQKLALVEVADPVSAPGRIRAMHLLGARFIGWLLLPPLVPHDSLIGAVWGFGWELWHALLATVFSTLILHTFEIVFLGHHASLVLLSIRRLWSRGSCCLVVSNPKGPVPSFCSFLDMPIWSSLIACLLPGQCPARYRRSSAAKQKTRPAASAGRASLGEAPGGRGFASTSRGLRRRSRRRKNLARAGYCCFSQNDSSP